MRPRVDGCSFYATRSHKNHANLLQFGCTFTEKLYTVHVAQVGYMTPGELRRGVEELRDNWNVLRAQVLGRGIAPRADLPKAVTDQVLEFYSSFRRWYESLVKSFLTEMFGMYQREFQVQLRRYETAREISNKALSSLPKREKLKAPGMQEFKDEPTISPWLIAIVAVGAAVYFWRRSEK